MATRRTSSPPAPATAPAVRKQGVAIADAAEVAVEQNVTRLHLPGLGAVSLPPMDHLAWYGGVAALTAMELIEWPVALVLSAGKALADNRSHRTLRSLGEALEEAG